MKKRNVRWACVLAAVGVVGMVGGAVAQPDTPTTPPARPGRGLPPKPTPKPAEPAPAAPDPNAPSVPDPSAPAPPPSQPAAPAAPAAAPQPKAPPAPPTKWKEAPAMGPYVKQVSPRDLTLTVDVRIHLDNATQKQSYRDPFSGKTVDMPQITPMKFNTLGFVFPLVPRTGSSDLFADDYKGLLRINGREVTEQFRVLTGYPAGTKLAEWEAGAPDTSTEARQVELHVEVPQRCYNTAFDEAAAMAVPWPTMAWPAEAASCLGPQLWIEAAFDPATGRLRMYEDKQVKEAMKQVFEDKGMTDLKRVPPVRVAKMIAEKVWGTVQVNGEGMVFMRTGEFAGMDLQSPGQTLELKKGSEQDVAVTVCAMMKKAGLPARTVIGFDVNGRDIKFLNKSGKNNRLRTWVEFALFDEAKNTINWVPVDVARMRKTTSRPTPIERSWPYFGTHDELDSVPVLAVTFHPPTDVVAYGAPAFWGWFVTPAPATNAEQGLRFMATPTARRGGEDAKDPKNPKKDEKGKLPVKKGY